MNYRNKIKFEDINEFYRIYGTSNIIYNPEYNKLFNEETDSALTGYDKVVKTNFGAVSINTGVFTGRSPKDKYIVYDDVSMENVWWADGTCSSSNNYPISEDIWKILKKLVIDYLFDKRLFVIDAFCGASENIRINLRFITDVAWQAHFVKNMFLQPTLKELANFKPNFIAINASKCKNLRWKDHGLNSENFIVLNLKERMQIIGGTWYNGEIKKGIFSVMNYFLPLNGIATMHCAANVGKSGDVAAFFGLSGTGKTTLSIDSNRKLIGDDEHGWSNDGIFNFEGGCYAKIINLSKYTEPEIFFSIKRNALLENVFVSSDGYVNFNDSTITNNTRVSFPIYHIKNFVKHNVIIGHPKKIIFLMIDCYSVFPIVSALTLKQAEYYFLSGFTTKLINTEIGVEKPIPIFSACFGLPFLTLNPIYYNRELSKKINDFGAKVYLVNTGNGFNDFQRLSISCTRKVINSILNGNVDKSDKISLPIFNLAIPKYLPGINNLLLDPRNKYDNFICWEKNAIKLAKKFIKNFEKYENNTLISDLAKYGPII